LKHDKGPHYFYYDLEECVNRSEIIDQEIIYFIKYKGQCEIKTVYDSKIIGSAIMSNREIMSKEVFPNF